MTGRTVKRALLIGGGGPTGPLVVNALLDDGYEVSVLNTGRHPVEYAGPVERIIADPHFLEPLQQVMRGRQFEVAIVQYGRLRLVAEALKGHVEHLVAIGGMFYPGWIDPAATVRPTSETGEARDWTVHHLDEGAPMPEHVPLDPVGKFGERVVETDTLLRWAHQHGAFDATILRYPRVYGPRQPGAAEWSIIRRILEGRRQIIVPEGGFLLQSVLYIENAARIVMAAVRNRSASAGQAFNCADQEPLTHRKWISLIARAMGREGEVEAVSVPMGLSRPAWPYSRFPLTTGHHVLDLTKMNALLPHNQVPIVPAVQRTVDWYMDDPETRGRAVEPLLKDAFRYDVEDRIVAGLDKLLLEVDALGLPDPDMAHPYSHPKAGNQQHVEPKGTAK